MALNSIKRDEDDYMAEYRPNLFGYGTEIYLDGEQCEKLGITKALRVGQPVTIRATGLVTRSTEELEASDDSGGKDVCLSIQITELEVRESGPANAAKAAEILYGKAES